MAAFNLETSKELIDQVDGLIRSNNSSEAWAVIKDIRPSEFDESYLVDLADLARRLNQPLYSLKILRSKINDHRDKLSKASDRELFVYAANLVKLGLNDEARKMAQELEEQGFSEAYNLRARIEMAEWNYRSATYYLKRYIKTLDKTSYKYIVGLLNLTASQIVIEEYDRAQKNIDFLISWAQENSNKLIESNALELLAQVLIGQMQFQSALQAIDDSHNLMNDSQSIYSFFLIKLKLTIKLLSLDYDDNLESEIKVFKEECTKRDYLEGIRDIEHYELKLTKNKSLFQRLYFGTHYKGFKERLKSSGITPFQIPSRYLWHISNNKQNTMTKIISIRDIGPQGGHCQRLFEALTKDFYRPLSLGFVFSHLYPGEYFNPLSSENRVYQLVLRLRKSLKDIHEDLDVTWNQEGITLSCESQDNIAIKIERNVISHDKTTEQVKLLRKKFGKSWFKSNDAKNVLTSSLRQSQKIIALAFKEGKLLKEGSGRSLRYRFK